jgi:S-adenosylhomocysteine hydrolase
MLPKKLDEEVAFSHLAALDIKLTKLTTEQVRDIIKTLVDPDSAGSVDPILSQI